MEEQLTAQSKCDTTRTDRIIKWLLLNRETIDSYHDGNLTFSFKERTLKAKNENYEQLM